MTYNEDILNLENNINLKEEIKNNNQNKEKAIKLYEQIKEQLKKEIAKKITKNEPLEEIEILRSFEKSELLENHNLILLFTILEQNGITCREVKENTTEHEHESNKTIISFKLDLKKESTKKRIKK